MLRREGRGDGSNCSAAAGTRPQAFLYAFDLLELNGHGPAARAHRGAQGDTGQHPAQGRHGVRLNEHLEHAAG